jgi:hypothetical protein
MREKLLSIQYKFSIIVELIIELKADLFMSRKKLYFPQKYVHFFYKKSNNFSSKIVLIEC